MILKYSHDEISQHKQTNRQTNNKDLICKLSKSIITGFHRPTVLSLACCTANVPAFPSPYPAERIVPLYSNPKTAVPRVLGSLFLLTNVHRQDSTLPPARYPKPLQYTRDTVNTRKKGESSLEMLTGTRWRSDGVPCANLGLRWCLKQPMTVTWAQDAVTVSSKILSRWLGQDYWLLGSVFLSAWGPPT